MRLHIHRRTWGEPFDEGWHRRPDWRSYTIELHPKTETYTRVFQYGTCSKCGHIVKRELVA